jgi:putative chitinase
MVNSTKPGPATHHGGHHHHRRHRPTTTVPPKPLLPAKTPGVNGNKDQGDPNHTTWLGWTPSLTGVRDWADHSLHELEDWFHHMMGGVGPQHPGGPPVSTGSAALAPVKGPLTVALLKKIFTGAQDKVLQQISDEINADPKKFGLDTPLRRAHFFAQVLEEGGRALKAKREDTHYRASMLHKFSYYKAHPDEIDQDGSLFDASGKMTQKANAQVIANKIYGGRMKDLGNGPVSSGDGWNFRGRGIIQVTGRANYQSVTDEYKKLFTDKVDFMTDPDKMAEFPWDVRSAVAYWVMNGLPARADKGATPQVVDSITDVVNSLTDTRDARKANFKETYDVFK